jgi:hypothetical protein
LINKLFFLFLFALSVQANADEQWERLLFLTRENLSFVKTDSFYQKGVREKYYQLYRAMDYLDDESYSCFFPARYLFLTESVNVDKLLERCDLLRDFYQTFRKKKLSLAHAEEYLGAPSSVFGHLYLVMHDESVPEISASVVSFNAVIDQNVSLMSYIFRGITGGFGGEFVGDILLRKEYEYLFREQRQISYYQIEMTDRQYDMLVFLLFELRGIQFDYFFFTKNCAYQIDYVLSLVLNRSHPNPTIYSLPKDVVTKFRNLIEKEVIINPLSVVLERELISKGELSQDFDRDVAQFKFLMGRNLNDNELDSFRSDRSSFYELNTKIVEGDDYLFGARRANIQVSDSKILNLSFTPLLKYRDTVFSGNVSSFTMGRVVAEINEPTRRFYLAELNLLELSSFPDFNNLTRKLSWEFSSGLIRDPRSSSLNFATILRIGMSKRLADFTIGLTLGPQLILSFPRSKTDYLANLLIQRSFFGNTVVSIVASQGIRDSQLSSFNASVIHFINNRYAFSVGYEKQLNRDGSDFTLSFSAFF